MHILLGLIAVAVGILIWVLRVQSAARAAKDLNRDTQGLQRRAKRTIQDVFGSRLERVNDPRLGAVILMIQLVRTGSPVTATEKTTILDLMETPLGISKPQSMFEKAWGYTEQRAFFSVVSDQLLPMLRDKLAQDERLQLVDMLQKTADAYNGASELQQSAINRFKKRLLAA